MLDTKTYKFLDYLVNKTTITHKEYFEYHRKHKTNNYETIQMYVYLLNNNYIMLRDDKIHYTYQTNVIVKYYKENKLNNIFINHILPYIHEFFIFLIGLLTPYLLQIIKYILKISHLI